MPSLRLTLPSLRPLLFRDWLIIGAGALLLLGLSGWQWQRLGQKQGLLQQIATGLSAPPKQAISAQDLTPYRGYNLTLALDKSHCFVLQNQANLDGQLGRRCLCWAEFPAAGGSVALTFPWEKMDLCAGGESTPQPLNSSSTIPTTVQAFALPAPRANLFMPANPVKGDWWWMDVDAIPKRLGVDAAGFQSKLYLQVASYDEELQRWRIEKNLNLPNNHLQYALTWLLLAVVWVGMMVKARLAAAMHRQASEGQKP